VARTSTDGGATFASQVQLSSGSGATFRGISVSGNNVYVLWGATSSVNLSRSIDGGASFYNPVNLSNTTGQIHAATVRADDFKPEDGFTPLFGGKDLAGWKTEKGEPLDGKMEAYGGRFKLADGVLTSIRPRPVSSSAVASARTGKNGEVSCTSTRR